MPIRHPAPVTPFNILRLSHVELGVTDLERSRRFYADTLGLIVSEQVGLHSTCAASRSATTTHSS